MPKIVIKFNTRDYGLIEWDQGAREVYFVTGDIVAPVDRFGEFVHPMYGWRFRVTLLGGTKLERVQWEEVKCDIS
jgi:hypothetical protein